jgi:hypothetical protein
MSGYLAVGTDDCDEWCLAIEPLTKMRRAHVSSMIINSALDTCHDQRPLGRRTHPKWTWPRLDAPVLHSRSLRRPERERPAAGVRAGDAVKRLGLVFPSRRPFSTRIELQLHAYWEALCDVGQAVPPTPRRSPPQGPAVALCRTRILISPWPPCCAEGSHLPAPPGWSWADRRAAREAC